MFCILEYFNYFFYQFSERIRREAHMYMNHIILKTRIFRLHFAHKHYESSFGCSDTK